MANNNCCQPLTPPMTAAVSHGLCAQQLPIRFIDILDVKLVEARGLLVRPASASLDRQVCCVVKMDNEEMYSTSVPAKTANPYFGEDFHFALQKKFRVLSLYLFDQYSGRVARPLGRLTFRKEDIVNYSGQEHWFDLRPFNRHSDVTGKVCLEISSHARQDQGDEDGQWRLQVRMVDVCDLSLPLSRSTEVYALLRVQRDADGFCSETKKLRIGVLSQESSNESNVINFDLPAPLMVDGADQSDQSIYASHATVGALCLRLSVWHDMPRSFSTFFHGEVRVPLLCPRQFDQPKSAWYYLKPRLRGSERINRLHRGDGSSQKADNYGSMKLQLKYTVDHVLPSAHYDELWTLLTHSLTVQPFRASVLGLFYYLPKAESDRVVLPLVRSFLHSNQVKQFIHALCTEEITQCQDVNTLFRNCSFASRCVFELMKLVGHQYLVSTLKPCLDKIFVERKSCEVDPGRISSGQNLVDNSKNLIVYTESTLSRIVDSNHRCPQLLKDVFKIMREVTAKHYPNRLDVQWLVLSSFLIMRFFAAALLNPKSFGLRRDNPDSNVNRTLALISKVIQRLSNFVVCGRKLSDKEAFMVPIWERFSDERHRLAFVKFFDRISCARGDNSVTGDSVTVLKEGVLYEHMDSGHCFGRTCVSSKSRRCFLTETEFYWCKQKDSTRIGQVCLSDVVFIQAVEKKHRGRMMFQMSTRNAHVYWEASSSMEMGEWIALLKKTCRRQQLTMQQASDVSQVYEIDVDHQLENIHLSLLRYVETFRYWKDMLEDEHAVGLVKEFPVLQSLSEPSIRPIVLESLQAILCCTFTLEERHRGALVAHFKQTKYGSKDLPIGDDNYLLLRSRMREYSASAEATGRRDEKDPTPCCFMVTSHDETGRVQQS